MSLAAACGWSLARSTGVALVSAPVSVWLDRRLSSLAGPVRTAAWGLLLVPFLFPTLLSGYAYSETALGLVGAELWARFPPQVASAIREWLGSHNSFVDELLLCSLLLCKAAPVGTIILRFAPRPPYSPSAWHCRQLSKGMAPNLSMSLRERWDYTVYGPARGLLAAISLMFLVAFQEFELPSLLKRPAWTVWLFDAQVGGLALAESLRAVTWPLVIQLLVVVPLWRSLRRGTGAPRHDSAIVPPSRLSALRDGCYLLAAFSLSCLIPIALVGTDTARGLVSLAGKLSQLERFTRDSLSGFFFALIAAWIARWLVEWNPPSKAPLAAIRRWILPILAIPGLFGPLVLSLSLVAALQWSLFNPVYRTPVSLVLGLTLHLLPRALLLAAVLRVADRDAARHSARLLADCGDRTRTVAAHELSWRLGGSARFWILAGLTFWGYLELTIAYLLGPTTIVSVPVLLYNQMHFGKNAVLSAMTFLAVVVPVALFIAAAALRPFIRRSLWR